MTISSGRSICRIDCTQEFGPESYFQHGETRVVASPLGNYREAAGEREARFGYRFRIVNPGVPHELIIRYPDDKPRFMCIMDGSTYDCSTGIFSGGAIPLSGAMREIRMVCWPRWSECTLIFMTWQASEPAAVASFELRELDELPSTPASDADDGIARREFGMAFEDPCGMGLSLGAASRAQWIDRITRFMRYSGQSLLIYPLAWYHGAQFPSQREPADAFETAVAPDHRMYGRYTTNPPEWVAPLLETFSAQHLSFLGEVRFFRLGSLMRQMNTDLAAIRAGADTINNMLWNDQVQSGTMDWTVVYNARNYPEMLARQLSVHVCDYVGFPFAYGEQCYADIGGGYPSSIIPPGAIFNPLHPVVQQAILGFVREIGQRYGQHPAFRGIAVGMWSETFLWYGSLRRGYDDVSVRLFQQDTGIEVLVDAKAPDRFSQRHAFLTAHCREEWVAWRCRRLRDLLLAMRDTLRESRADLCLVLAPNPGNLAWAEGAMDRPAETLLREAGFDPALLLDEPGIEIDMAMEGGAGLSGADAAPQPLMANTALTGICVADTWVESWGRNRMFPCDANDPNIELIGQLGGQRADIYRFTCEYPPDGFWYQDQWRISTPFPAGEHYLAPLARAVADTDALRLTRGGLYPDTAHAGEQRRFARAFSALPRVKFATIIDSGPVVVRAATVSDRQYCYAVNREATPAHICLALTGEGVVHDLLSGEQACAGGAWEIELAPYELRSYVLAENKLIRDG